MTDAPRSVGGRPEVGLPLAYLAAMATIVMWSGNTIVTKSAASVIEPASIAFYRWLLAFTVMTPFLGAAVWASRAIVAANGVRLASLGILGMATYQGLAYQAAKSTTAVNMGIIIALMPLLTSLLANLLAGERLTIRRVTGAGISLIGLIILTTSGDPFNLLHSEFHTGDALMLVAVFSNALYGVLLRRWAIPLPTWQQLYVQVGCGTLFILPFWLASSISPVTASSLPLVLYAGLIVSILAPFCWITGVKRLGAGRAALFLNLLPPIVALLAWLVLGETLHPFHFVGGAVTLIGVAIAL